MKADHRAALLGADYERMFRVIHGVLLSEKGDPSKACLYFSVIGAYLLERHHRLKAEPVVGLAAYRLAEQTLFFGQHQDGRISCAIDGFHSWIEVGGRVIDLQAPLFPDMQCGQGAGELARRMFQKSLSECVATPEELVHSGAAWYARDDAVRAQLLQNFLAKPANTDLAEICSNWYRPHPKAIREFVGVGDQHGRVKRVPLSPVRVEGRW